jgi:hypothetical protein
MIRISRTYLTIAVLVLCISVSLSADRRFEKKFSVNSGGTFTLSTDVGSVDIVGTNSNEVSIVADLRGRERDINDFEINAVKNDNGVEVTGRGRKSNWFWNSNDMDVRYTVRVPHEYNLRLNTSGGDIGISTVKGKVQGETSGGNIRLADIEGEVNLNTSGGNINVDKAVGSVHMETSGGEIELAMVTGDVDVSTSGGNIRISDVTGKVRAETSGGDVIVRVKKENRGVYAETSGGDIEIAVAKDISANIDASTSGGEVTCDLPITMSGKIDESRIRGTVNGGGNTIHAHTSGGNVRIRATE